MSGSLVNKRLVAVVGALVIGLWGTWAMANVLNMGDGLTSLQFVPVGNLGNAADTTGYGSVSYAYSIGKFEVTAGQYCAFLNAVAATDQYGLYNPRMDANFTPVYVSDKYGCGIVQSGTAGSYTYSISADRANRPVNFIGWGDAARFCNWLENGQRATGVEDQTTTEDGSYVLNGATSNAALMAVTRKTGAIYVIPTENEWYKPAYYDPNKSGGAGYWLYPTRSNSFPSNSVDPNGKDNANFVIGTSYSVGSPYWETEVGAFSSSPGAYGTSDMGGNVWEWNEAVVSSTQRGLRGGSFLDTEYGMESTDRWEYWANFEYNFMGLRVAEIPEPVTMAMLALGGLGMLLKRKNAGQ
ncbi:MAG: SUMF1/EgtB/PvdO family nonheme iron enzyme [Phycisphaerae bacterium]